MTTEHAATEGASPGAVASPGRPRSSRRRGVITFLRDVVVIVLIAVTASFLIKTFVVRSFYIPSASMQDTLLIQDRILVDELTPRFTGYERGDVVVFADPGGWLPVSQTPPRQPIVAAIDGALAFVGLSAPDSEEHLIKRLIGLPGDHVVCCNPLGQITVNGVPIDEESYITHASGNTVASQDPFDVVVPDDALWVLGDNRDRSKDSRYNQDQPGDGFVPVENVVGRAFVITWPFDRFGWIDAHHDVFVGVPDPAP